MTVTSFEHKYSHKEPKKNPFKIELKYNIISNPNSNFSNYPKTTTIHVIIVDDEYMIRNAMKRLITNQLKNKDHIELIIIEANDGIECLLAIYLATINQIKIDFIITDENMTYINGTFASEIIKTVVKNGKFQDVPIFMATALGKNIIDSRPDIIKKVFSKPMDKNSIRELLVISGVLNNNRIQSNSDKSI